MKRFLPFLWAAVHRLPAQCPPIQDSSYWASASFSSLLSNFLVPLPEKEGYLLLVEWETEDRGEIRQGCSCALTSFSWVSGAALTLLGSVSLEKGLRVRACFRDSEYAWLSSWCLRFELVWKPSLGLTWFGANAINSYWLSPKVS